MEKKAKKQKPVERPFYSIDEVCTLTGISRLWYYELTKKGEFNFRTFRRGRRVWIYREDVEKYLAEHTHQPASKN